MIDASASYVKDVYDVCRNVLWHKRKKKKKKKTNRFKIKIQSHLNLSKF